MAIPVAIAMFVGAALADQSSCELEMRSADVGPRQVWMEVTAYCPCAKCCGHTHGITASGKTVRYNHGRFVAADASVLPFGSRIIVPGYNASAPVEVIDRGGAIRGNRIDVFFPTHAEAMRWGRQWLSVTVLTDAK